MPTIEKTKVREQLGSLLGLMHASLESGQQLDGSQLAAALESIGEDYTFIEGMIEDADVLNPDREDEFDPMLKLTKMEALKTRLRIWIDLLKGSSSSKEVQEKAEKSKNNADSLIHKNMENILRSTRDLETYTRAVASFYENAGKQKPILSNIYFLKSSITDIKDTAGESTCIALVREELQNRYDMNDKRDSCARVVVPLYFGERVPGEPPKADELPPSGILKEYAEMAYQYKTLLVTDYRDVDSVEKFEAEFPRSKLAGEDAWRSTAVMVMNRLIGRAPYKQYGEKNPLSLPSSLAVAGRMYLNDVSEPAAGAGLGQLSNIVGLKMDILKSVGKRLAEMGVVVVRRDGGKFYPESLSNLRTGDGIEVEEKVYSIVSTKQTIEKGIQHIVDHHGYQKLTGDKQVEIKKEISLYLNKQVQKKRIRTFGDIDLFPDPLDPTQVAVKVSILPEVPVKDFNVDLKSMLVELSRKNVGGVPKWN